MAQAQRRWPAAPEPWLAVRPWLAPQQRGWPQAGYSLSEILVASAISLLVIGSAGLALQSQLRSIRGSTALVTGRDSNATGLALLRAEVLRGHALLFRLGSSTVSDNLDSSSYTAAIGACAGLSGSRPFEPVFAIRSDTSTVPAIYGLSIGGNGTSYALRRCGPPIGGNTSPVLSTVIEGIAPMPCGDGRSRCASPGLDADGNASDLPGVLAGLSHTLGSDNTSPGRSARQPAFRFRTDSDHRLLQLIDPSGGGDAVEHSFTSSDPTGVSLQAPLYLSARVQSSTATSSTSTTSSTCLGCSFFGLPVRGTGLTFSLDGSSSMSACIAWAGASDLNPNNETRKYWNPGNAGDALSNAWISTARSCLKTRMQLLQQQMTQLLTNLPDSTQVQIVVRSVGGSNDRSWPSGAGWATLGAGNQRAEAIAFINSLSSGDPETWGATSNPWSPMRTAVLSSTVDTIYVVVGDLPNSDCYGNDWSSTVFESTCRNSITNLNSNRAQKVSIHSLSIGLDSNWLRTLSINNYGTYLRL